MKTNLKYNIKNKKSTWKIRCFLLPVFPHPLPCISFTFWLAFSPPLSAVAALRTKYGMASWEASSYCGALTGSWKSAYTWRWVERAMFPGHRKGKPQKSPFHCIFGSFQMKLWDPPSQPWGQGPRFSFCFLDKKMIWNGMKERPSPSPSMWRIFVLVWEKPGTKSSSFSFSVMEKPFPCQTFKAL